MKKIYERETQKNKQRQKIKGGGGAKWFCYAFKLGFLHLICKASLIFKSNLELALSIISNKENYMSQNMLQWSVDV